MKPRIIIGVAMLIMVLAMTSVSAQYPTVVGDSEPSVPGPTPTVGCNYSFVVNVPGGTFQSVQVVIDGVAYDLEYINGAWRGEFCCTLPATYFYRITTRSGITFEASPHQL
jgi:hypothetical protein